MKLRGPRSCWKRCSSLICSVLRRVLDVEPLKVLGASDFDSVGCCKPGPVEVLAAMQMGEKLLTYALCKMIVKE